MTNKSELSLLFQFNEVLVASDGAEARAGTISTSYNWFRPWKSVNGEEPAQAETRAQLRELLRREAGGVIFTTIQKFMPKEQGDAFPQLSDRRNIIVVADEAHRSLDRAGARGRDRTRTGLPPRDFKFLQLRHGTRTYGA